MHPRPMVHRRPAASPWCSPGAHVLHVHFSGHIPELSIPNRRRPAAHCARALALFIHAHLPHPGACLPHSPRGAAYLKLALK